MAEKSFPWTANATGDGTSGGYTALEWSEIWRDAYLGGGEASQGVMRGVGNELAVTGTSSPLAVNTGSAVVYGKFYRNTASVNLTVSTPSVGTTGGHVILRLDWTAQTVRLVAVRNTDGLSAIPSLTQSLSTQWEIRLASFTITTGGTITVTDARSYAYFGTKVKTAMLDDSAITTVKIADSNVTTAKINNAAVDENKLAASVAGAGLTGGAGTALAINPDGTSLALSGDTLLIAAGGVDTSKIANDAVDDTKVGNRVPQIRRRQGNDASDWRAAGTTTFTPTTVRMEVGALSISGGVSVSGTQSVTFPEALSNPPIVLVTTGSQDLHAAATTITSTGFTISWKTISGGAGGTFNVYWFIIGPE